MVRCEVMRSTLAIRFLMTASLAVSRGCLLVTSVNE